MNTNDSNLNILKLITMMSALFHDLGKSSIAFQLTLNNNIDGNHQKRKAIIRHELLSALICMNTFKQLENAEEFNGTNLFRDQENVLEALTNAQEIISKRCVSIREITQLLNELSSFLSDSNTQTSTFFKLITWLTLSHHKLPHEKMDASGSSIFLNSLLSNAAKAITHTNHSFFDEDVAIEHISPYLTCDMNSLFWITPNTKWITHLVTLSRKLSDSLSNCTMMDTELWFAAELYCRPALVFGDYSASSKKEESQRSGELLANLLTTKKNHVAGDTLETHSIKVMKETSNYFDLFFFNSGILGETVPESFQPKKIETETQIPTNAYKFNWQNEAAQLCVEANKDRPNFALVVAGTGFGKTKGLAQMALAFSEKPRFTLCLGLRGLSSQSYNEYCDKLGLSNYTTLLIGGRTKTAGHDIVDEIPKDGSDHHSTELAIFNETISALSNGGKIPNELLIFGKETDSLSIINAPICIQTIDHYTGTSNFERSPNLTNLIRPITSDLVLDEIDNYTNQQIGSIAWLIMVHAAYGRNVIVSSATITPRMASYLNSAFQKGASLHSTLHCYNEEKQNVIVATGVEGNNSLLNAESCKDKTKFEAEFINLMNQAVSSEKENQHNTHVLDLLDLKNASHEDVNFSSIAKQIINEIPSLHDNNNTLINNKKVSFGVIKLNRTNDVISLATQLCQSSSESNIELRIACYHSNYDSLSKGYIEKWLSKNLNRKNTAGNNDTKYNPFVHVDELTHSFSTSKDLCVIFVCTNIIEVGRDYDFDWGIYEPSGYQSLIQFKGRINRHRCLHVNKTNVKMLSHTISEIINDQYCHYGIGNSTFKSPRNTQGIKQTLKNLCNKDNSFKKNANFVAKNISTTLLTDDELKTANKWSLNTMALDKKSALIIAEFLDFEESQQLVRIDYNNNCKPVKPLNDLVEFSHTIGRTSAWFNDHQLRDGKNKVTIFNLKPNPLDTQDWNFFYKKNKTTKTCFIVTENTDNHPAWLFKFTIKELEAKSEDLIRFDVNKDRLNSQRQVALCARTGIKD